MLLPLACAFLLRLTSQSLKCSTLTCRRPQAGGEDHVAASLPEPPGLSCPCPCPCPCMGKLQCPCCAHLKAPPACLCAKQCSSCNLQNSASSSALLPNNGQDLLLCVFAGYASLVIVCTWPSCPATSVARAVLKPRPHIAVAAASCRYAHAPTPADGARPDRRQAEQGGHDAEGKQTCRYLQR
jgi:hypothetical protein